MNKITLEPGRHYRGSFWLNEYGEIQVRPEQKGSKPGNMKLVLENDLFTLCESSKLFKVTLKIEKATASVTNLTNRFLFILSQIQQYLKK